MAASLELSLSMFMGKIIAGKLPSARERYYLGRWNLLRLGCISDQIRRCTGILRSQLLARERDKVTTVIEWFRHSFSLLFLITGSASTFKYEARDLRRAFLLAAFSNLMRRLATIDLCRPRLDGRPITIVLNCLTTIPSIRSINLRIVVWLQHIEPGRPWITGRFPGARAYNVAHTSSLSKRKSSTIIGLTNQWVIAIP